MRFQYEITTNKLKTYFERDSATKSKSSSNLGWVNNII